MYRKGFTLVELLVVVAIIGIILIMICGLGAGCTAKDPVTGQSYYNVENIDTFQCVKTYTVNDGETSTSKRVDLRPEGGGAVVTMTCDDDFRAGIRNSATLYAQFEPDNWYEVSSVGFRLEGWRPMFALVVAVNQVEDPTPQEIENLILPEDSEARTTSTDNALRILECVGHLLGVAEDKLSLCTTSQ